MAGTVSVTGTVLDVEHKQGTFNRDDGNAVAYDFYVAHVLVGRKVTEVRFNPDNGDARPPAIDTQVSIDVEVPKGTRLIAQRYSEAAKPSQVRSAS